MHNKILIASDHAGFELKSKIKSHLESLGYEVKDFGASTYNAEDDFTDFIVPLAKEISRDESLKGIILGGSGQGEAIVANKFNGVRAVVYYGAPENSQVDIKGNMLSIIASTRVHNDANILSLGARFMTEDEALLVINEWLSTGFSEEERHKRRNKIIGEFGQNI